MGKYSHRQVPLPERPWEIHPIWRGIGCLIMIMAPIMAFAAADLLIKMDLKQGWLPLPPEFRRTIKIPQLGFPIENAYATLVVTILLILLGFTVVMVVYSIIYSITGPRRNPLDAPPIRQSPASRRNRR